MIRVTALYPRNQGAEFDHDYYESQHHELLEERLGPLGMVRAEVDRGLAGMDGPPAPFVAAGHLYFRTLEDFRSAMEERGDEVLGDVPNFTDIDPVLQVSEVVVPGGTP